MKKLIEEFSNISNIPMFEIEADNDGELEYHVYYIQADEKGLHAGTCTNIGFKAIEGLSVEWCKYSSLNSHLEELYELCLEDAYNL